MILLILVITVYYVINNMITHVLWANFVDEEKKLLESFVRIGVSPSLGSICSKFIKNFDQIKFISKLCMSMTMERNMWLNGNNSVLLHAYRSLVVSTFEGDL